MNILKHGFMLAFIAVSLSSAEKFSFEGYKIVSLLPKSENNLKLISDLQHNSDFDLLNNVRQLNKKIYVVLSPEAFVKYSKVFSRSKIEFKVVDENIQKKIDLESESLNRKRDSRNILGKYPTYSEVMNYIDDMVEAYPTIASSYSAGRTAENRNLKTIVLKTATSQKGLYIDCGIHAREWITVSSCIWMIDRFLKEYSAGNADARKILNKYEIHVVPILNPDGYEYSQSTFRMWRKNRATHQGTTCIGVDLNRNFDFQWMVAGASSNPCSDSYAGPNAGSELETKAVEKAINDKLGIWDAYISIHSYGHYWLSSWSYSATIYPSDYDELLAAAKAGVNGVATVNGTKYTAGHSGNIFGALAGASDDWAKGTANIKYSYTLELSPGEAGVDPEASFGFGLPEDRVPRVGEELYQGVKAFLNHLLSL